MLGTHFSLVHSFVRSLHSNLSQHLKLKRVSTFFPPPFHFIKKFTQEIFVFVFFFYFVSRALSSLVSLNCSSVMKVKSTEVDKTSEDK